MNPILHQSNRTQYLAGSGEQFLDAQLFGIGTEGKAHQPGDVNDRDSIAGFVGFFDGGGWGTAQGAFLTLKARIILLELGEETTYEFQ